MTRRAWTPYEIGELRTWYAIWPISKLAAHIGCSVAQVSQAAYHHGLRKSPQHLAKQRAQCQHAGNDPGAAHRFKPGFTPWNKGVPGSTGKHPNTAANHFKPGNLNGRAAHLVQPIGALHVTDEGILERKTGTLPGASNLRWTPVHRLVWQAAHGPVPAGHIVAFKPGRKSTELALITLDAIELITRAENMRRNSLHNLPKDLAELVQLRGALNRQINKRSKPA